MEISFGAACKQAHHPHLRFMFETEPFNPIRPKEKVLFVNGNTRTSKGRLSINSKKINRHPRPQRFDVFISHCGKDTKLNLASLLYDRFVDLKLHPFLDYKSMKLGDDLYGTIESAIRGCKVGVTLFSPNFCSSTNCLEELALMLEWEKKLIPIFFDIKTSDLVLLDDGTYLDKQLHRFGSALDWAKGKVGISFDSKNSDWSYLLRRVSESVVENLE